MESKVILDIAEELGFEKAAVVRTGEIPLNAEFRKYCEDNLCGKYGVNYTCPPDCGTTDEMKAQLLSKTHAVVLKTLWEMDYRDQKSVKENKEKHNSMVRSLMERLPKPYQGGFMIAASGCTLCDECAIVKHEPCRFPELKASCVSAYCIYVAELCNRLGWTYFEDGKVGFFGLYVFDIKE